jgi:hypothetical protein
VSREALSIDPQASEIEAGLIWLCATTGARAAATGQYAHFSVVYRDLFAIEPPSFADVIAEATRDFSDK